jgi:polar amino acid transport system substrate-binding protein
MVGIGSRIAALLLIAPLIAARVSALTSDSVRKELAPTGTLLATRDAASGEIRGLAVDLSRELARRVGVPLKLIPCDAASKITANAKNNVWDIGYLGIDPLRANDIDFTAAYVELEGTYLVPAGSSLRRIEDVDRDGVRIAVTMNSAYDLFLSRELKHAQIVRADNTPQSVELLLGQKLDAVAAVRTALVTAAKQLPGSRVLSGHFMTIPQAAGVPKGRPAAARYVSEFIEEMKASGFVASALKKYGFGPDDAIVAPPETVSAPFAVEGRMMHGL